MDLHPGEQLVFEGHIRRGLFAKRVQQTRIDRVQNVNTEQSLRERLLHVVVDAVDGAQREAAAVRG